MFLITPSALLLRCPRCDVELPEAPESEKYDITNERVCACGYAEPSTSARALTFIESALDEYLRNIKIDTFRSGDKTIESSLGVSATGCLPIFVSRAEELLGAEHSAELKNLFPLLNVPDNEAFLKERSVATTNSINVALAMLMLVEVVHEAIDLRPSFSQQHYKNELPIQHLLESYSYGQFGSALDISVKRTLSASNPSNNIAL